MDIVEEIKAVLCDVKEREGVDAILYDAKCEIERLRETLKKIVSFEGGNVFDVLHEIHSIAVEALENV